MAIKRGRSLVDQIAAIVADIPVEYLECRAGRLHVAFDRPVVELERKTGPRVLAYKQVCGACGTVRRKRYLVYLYPDLARIRIKERLNTTYHNPADYKLPPGSPTPQTSDYEQVLHRRLLAETGLKVVA
jgi:hypothetical protein